MYGKSHKKTKNMHLLFHSTDNQATNYSDKCRHTYAENI